MRADRPYPPTGLTSARWVAEVPVEEVDITKLWFTQESLSVAALLSPWTPTHCHDPIPHVVVYEDDWYLEDGHHRAIRDVMTGRRTILSRVFRH